VTKRSFASYWLPAILYVLLIFILSGMSRPPIPAGVSGDVLHVPEFALLGFLLARALKGERTGTVGPSDLLWAFVLAVAFGASDEFHQAFVPDRVPDVHDWIHDGIGAAAGVAAWGVWRWVRR
jgi:VanZ family protein